MRTKFIYLVVAAVLLLPLAPNIAEAASNTVTNSDALASVYLSDLDKSYTVTSIAVESFTVNAGTIELTMLNGSSATIVSSDRNAFSVTGYGSCNVTDTCGSSDSSVVISCATSQTVTITPSGTCTSSSSSQSNSGTGGGTPTGFIVYTAPIIPIIPPVITPITKPLVIAPVTIVPPAISAELPSVANPVSEVVISNINAASFQPGTALTYTYQYQNTGKTSQKVKIVRTIENSKGKAVKTNTATKTLKSGSTFVGKASDAIVKTLPVGDYTIKVKVLNSANKVLAENNFPITVEKLKKKYFELGDVAATDSAIVFDSATLAKVKTNVVLPANFKVKYSYANNTAAKQSVKMVRDVLNASGKAVFTSKGYWNMKAGETDSMTFTQAVAGNLSVGDYTIRLRAYDKKTNAVLAENSLDFTVELR